MASLLNINNVSMQFGGLRALGDVNFEIVEGEIFGLIGPNGAGKTTLFNCVTGVYAPTEGAVEFLGSSITGKRPDQIVDIGICRTFQQIRLFPNMTALENVIVGADARHKTSVFGAIFRSPRRKREERHAEEEALRLLDFCGIRRYANDLGRNLSYGDQRRLEIARALATMPKLVLLDEPAAGMNPVEKGGLRDLVRKIRDEGTTVLLIEHDMKVVMGLSDRVAVLDHGEVIAEGQPEAVQSDPKVIEAYLGTGGAGEAATDGQARADDSAPEETGSVSAKAQEPGGEK